MIPAVNLRRPGSGLNPNHQKLAEAIDLIGFYQLGRIAKHSLIKLQ
jgi:hypothetical protein